MRVQVVLNFRSDADTNIYWGNVGQPPQSNVSNPDEIFKGVPSGFAGFQLDVVPSLGGQFFFYPPEGYKGLVSSTLSDASGYINYTIPFHISGIIPERLYVSFDNISKEYATNFTLKNTYRGTSVTISNNTSTFVEIPMDKLDAGATFSGIKFELMITKWSKPNSSVKITGLSPFVTCIFTGRDLVDFECSENILDAQLSLETGICEQYANISVYDRINIIHYFAQKGKLAADHFVTIQAVDDNDGTTHELGTYIASEWNVQADNSSVAITCRDKSYLFPKINIVRSSIADRTIDDLLNILFNQAPGMTWQYKDEETQQRCAQIVVPNSWYLASDLQTMLNKICALGMLRIYWYLDTFLVGRCC